MNFHFSQFQAKRFGLLHFSGIGGIGMSGLAQIYHEMGFCVQGSDIKENDNIKRLINLGIPISLTQTGKNLQNVHGVVKSSAVPDTNPEIVYARQYHIPVIQRAEMLAELMRHTSSIAIAGTHGKTTTTSLIGHILETARLDPMVIDGGIINQYNTNVRFGQGDWVVCEADESDGSFLLLPALFAVITNIESDHMNYYKSFDDIYNKFLAFVHQIPFYGKIIACADAPKIPQLIADTPDRKFVTYGLSPNADIQARNITYTPNGTTFHVITKTNENYLDNVFVHLFGEHNIENVLAAISIAKILHIHPHIIKEGLATFQGVKRRFSLLGTTQQNIRIIDDYAHHPTEITSVLTAVKALKPHYVHVIFQPHRYSRLKALFQEFSQAFQSGDYVYFLPVYSAGEPEDPMFTHHQLAQSAKTYHTNKIYTIKDNNELFHILDKNISENDVCIFMGAGSITQIAHAYWAHVKN